LKGLFGCGNVACKIRPPFVHKDCAVLLRTRSSALKHGPPEKTPFFILFSLFTDIIHVDLSHENGIHPLVTGIFVESSSTTGSGRASQLYK
jgi:hypothetical protein